MPNITVTTKTGHSSAQKTAFAEAITAAAVTHLNVTKSQVIITYDEKPDGSFFRAGSKL